MIEPFIYGSQPGQFVRLNVEQLHTLLFSDSDEALHALAERAHKANPNVKQREFIRSLQERAKIIHGIATFLLAHLDFDQENVADRAVELAKSTLAHFLADDARRTQIELVFRRVAESLLADTITDELRAAIRRSPLAPRSVRALKQWLAENSQAVLQHRG
jgi:hypothetical protein